MRLPPVTVICLCYNQERFVRESILSVLNQNYPNIQLVVIDDASLDNSVGVITEILEEYPQIRFIPLQANSGSCRAFNHGLLFAYGEYIIDLAADDILLPDRIYKGVLALTKAGDTFGINFTDADWIQENGSPVFRHSQRFPHHTIPEGNIYRFLIERFFICSPTMMFRRKVMDSLGGYDERLAYEDFDFWIRSSRNYHYCYSPEVLVKKRIVKNSMSARQFTFLSPQLTSTFLVCEKIMILNRNREEQKSLGNRIRYEMGVCLRFLNFPLMLRYAGLYLRNRSRKYSKRSLLSEEI